MIEAIEKIMASSEFFEKWYRRKPNGVLLHPSVVDHFHQEYLKNNEVRWTMRVDGSRPPDILGMKVIESTDMKPYVGAKTWENQFFMVGLFHVEDL